MIIALVAGFLGGLSIRSRFQVDGLEAQLDSVKLSSAATDVLIGQVREDAASDAARADSVEVVIEAIRRDLTQARARSARVIVRVDSARATVDEDTLSAGLRNLLMIEREVAESYRVGWGLERRLREEAEAELTRIRPILDRTRLLLFTVQSQRDTALAIGTSLLAQVNPGFWGSLWADLPQKAACGAGGAAVAALNEGDAFLGAGIGVAVCIFVGAIL